MGRLIKSLVAGVGRAVKPALKWLRTFNQLSVRDRWLVYACLVLLFCLLVWWTTSPRLALLALLVIAAGTAGWVLIPKLWPRGGEGERGPEAEWKEHMDALRKRGVDPATLPMYLMLGESQCGKTQSIINSGQLSPGSDPLKGVMGTEHCDFWIADSGLFLDTAGQYTVGDNEAPPDREGWHRFLEWQVSNVPPPAINAMIVAIPCTSLLLDSPETIQRKANQLTAALLDLNEKLGLRLPVMIMLTMADRVAGFTEFASELAAVDRTQLFGWARPRESRRDPFNADEFRQGFDDLVANLRRWRLTRLVHGAQGGQQARDRLFLFPEEINALRAPLERYLTTMFRESPTMKPHFLRGFMLTSSMRADTPLMKAGLRILDGALPAEYDERAWEEPLASETEDKEPPARPFYVQGFYFDKVLKENGLAEPTSVSDARTRRLRRLAVGSLTSVAVLGLSLLGYWYWENWDEADAPRTALGKVEDRMMAVKAEMNKDGGARLKETITDSLDVLEGLARLDRDEYHRLSRGTKAPTEPTDTTPQADQPDATHGVIAEIERGEILQNTGLFGVGADEKDDLIESLWDAHRNAFLHLILLPMAKEWIDGLPTEEPTANTDGHYWPAKEFERDRKALRDLLALRNLSDGEPLPTSLTSLIEGHRVWAKEKLDDDDDDDLASLRYERIDAAYRLLQSRLTASPGRGNDGRREANHEAIRSTVRDKLMRDIENAAVRMTDRWVHSLTPESPDDWFVALDGDSPEDAERRLSKDAFWWFHAAAMAARADTAIGNLERVEVRLGGSPNDPMKKEDDLEAWLREYNVLKDAYDTIEGLRIGKWEGDGDKEPKKVVETAWESFQSLEKHGFPIQFRMDREDEFNDKWNEASKLDAHGLVELELDEVIGKTAKFTRLHDATEKTAKAMAMAWYALAIKDERWSKDGKSLPIDNMPADLSEWDALMKPAPKEPDHHEGDDAGWMVAGDQMGDELTKALDELKTELTKLASLPETGDGIENTDADRIRRARQRAVDETVIHRLQMLYPRGTDEKRLQRIMEANNLRMNPSDFPFDASRWLPGEEEQTPVRYRPGAPEKVVKEFLAPLAAWAESMKTEVKHVNAGTVLDKFREFGIDAAGAQYLIDWEVYWGRRYNEKLRDAMEKIARAESLAKLKDDLRSWGGAVDHLVRHVELNVRGLKLPEWPFAPNTGGLRNTSEDWNTVRRNADEARRHLVTLAGEPDIKLFNAETVEDSLRDVLSNWFGVWARLNPDSPSRSDWESLARLQEEVEKLGSSSVAGSGEPFYRPLTSVFEPVFVRTRELMSAQIKKMMRERYVDLRRNIPDKGRPFHSSSGSQDDLSETDAVKLLRKVDEFWNVFEEQYYLDSEEKRPYFDAKAPLEVRAFIRRAYDLRQLLYKSDDKLDEVGFSFKRVKRDDYGARADGKANYLHLMLETTRLDHVFLGRPGEGYVSSGKWNYGGPDRNPGKLAVSVKTDHIRDAPPIRMLGKREGDSWVAGNMLEYSGRYALLAFLLDHMKNRELLNNGTAITLAIRTVSAGEASTSQGTLGLQVTLAGAFPDEYPGKAPEWE